ncbi:MAG: low molecular weight protein-tyrosine-phosphatase YfkJ [Pseudomonadota bacterium]
MSDGPLRGGGNDAAPFRVLMVCLGNICRSPTAEAVLRVLAAREAPELLLEIDSAGTADYHVGDPPDRRSQRAGAARGYDLASLRGRQVEKRDFERFDLLLAMDRANYETLLDLSPASGRDRVRLFLSFAPELGLEEVPDPYYGGPEGFEQVLDLAEAASRGLLAALKR